MHEYVFTALTADESISLGVVKPLYCSCFHNFTWFLLIECGAEAQGVLQAGHATERGIWGLQNCKA
jgi:hypothetical protein